MGQPYGHFDMPSTAYSGQPSSSTQRNDFPTFDLFTHHETQTREGYHGYVPSPSQDVFDTPFPYQQSMSTPTAPGVWMHLNEGSLIAYPLNIGQSINLNKVFDAKADPPPPPDPRRNPPR